MTEEVTEAVIEESQTAPRDYEAEARASGWTDKDEFKGDPNRWVDAETFVNRAEELMPLLRKENKNLRSEMAEIKKMVKKLTLAEQNAYENAMADLKAKAESAVETGDVEAYKAVDKKMEALRKEAQSDVGHGESPDAVFDEFREANLWYDKGALASASDIEIEARLYADRLADRYSRQGLTNEMPPSEFFAKIEKEVKERFPALTIKQQRAKPVSPVEGATPRGNSNAKTGANLPPEAKRQAERFYRQGIIKGKDLTEALNTYAKSYDWN